MIVLPSEQSDIALDKVTAAGKRVGNRVSMYISTH